MEDFALSETRQLEEERAAAQRGDPGLHPVAGLAAFTCTISDAAFSCSEESHFKESESAGCHDTDRNVRGEARERFLGSSRSVPRLAAISLLQFEGS